MIGKECARVGDANRALYEMVEMGIATFLPFPEGCECAAMHRYPTQWEKQFGTGVIPPWKAVHKETEVL